MADFRYPQFCPVARAAEIVGERWTLLIVRELLLGPGRFSDLRRRLTGVSPSVLSERLRRMGERGVVAIREVGPPTPATLYELTESGRALTPVMLELTRWGARFLGAPQPGEHFEPDWMRIGLRAMAQTSPTPKRVFELRLTGGDEDVVIHAAGGRRGTVVTDEPTRAPDATVRSHPFALMALLAGALDPAQGLRDGQISVEGDTNALADLPALFTMQPGDAARAE